MPNYIRPGVYIDEYQNPISDISADAGTSAAAFVGTSSGGGPVGPIKISSWAQFQALFGVVGTNNDDLAYAIYTYFANGGTPCYVVRALNSDATPATLGVNDTEGSPVSTMTVTASAPGTWASSPSSSSRVYITVIPTLLPGAAASGRFDLLVEVGTGSYLAAREVFTDLSLDALDGRNAVDIVNSPVTGVGSKFITLTSLKAAPYQPTYAPAAITKIPLSGGSEGTGSPDVGAAATSRLANIFEDLVINLPGAPAASVSAVATWAAGLGKHFVVADCPKPTAGETAASYATDIINFVSTAAVQSSYLAFYGPWLYTVDPAARSGALRLTAPGGAVVGQFMRTDSYRGVAKAPAGVETRLATVKGPYADFTSAQEDSIITGQVNLIKTLPGAGICIFGAHTTAIGFPDRYVPIRRTLINIKSSLVALTRFAVFENNDETLWATLTTVCENYLAGLLSNGSLRGSKDSQAFYVTCDSTNNTQQTINAGEVHIEVGVALQNPAEFIVIRLGQTDQGTSVNDSLESIR